MNILEYLGIYFLVTVVIITGALWLIKTGDPHENPRDEHEDYDKRV